MPLSKTLEFLKNIEKNKNESINNNTQVKLNTTNTIAKELVSLPESLAILIGQKYIDNKTKENFLFSQQNTEGKSLSELGTNIISGGLTEKFIRQPLHTLIRDSLEKSLNKNLSKGIAFGSSTTAESALWSMPQSLQQNQDGSIGINKEALIKGTIANEGMALGLGVIGSLGNKEKKIEQVKQNNITSLELQEPTKKEQQLASINKEPTMQNMIDFNSDIPQYKPYKGSKFNDHELMDSFLNNETDLIRDFIKEQFDKDIKLNIVNDKDSETFGHYNPLNKTLTLNKYHIKDIDELKNTLSHELTHKNLDDSLGSRYGHDFNQLIDEYYAYLDSIKNSNNEDYALKQIDNYVKTYTPNLAKLIYKNPNEKSLLKTINNIKDLKQKNRLLFEYSLARDMIDLATGKKDINTILKSSIKDKNLLKKFLLKGRSVESFRKILERKGYSLNKDIDDSDLIGIILKNIDETDNKAIYEEPVDINNRPDIEDNYKFLNDKYKQELHKAYNNKNEEYLTNLINKIAIENKDTNKYKVKFDNSIDIDAELKYINGEPTLILNPEKIDKLNTNIGSIVEDEILNIKQEPIIKKQKGYDKFRNNIIEYLVNKDDIDINKIKINNKKLKKDYEYKLKTYLTNLYKEVVKSLKNPETKVSEEAINISNLIKANKLSINDFKKSFKIVKDNLLDEFNKEPTRLAKIDINNKNKAYIDDIRKEEILSMLLNKNDITGEIENKKLELKENAIARKLEKENQPKEKLERIQKQKESLEKYLQRKAKLKQKVDKVKIKKENQVNKYMKDLVEYFKKNNPRFKDKKLEELYNRYKNNINGLEKKLNEDYRTISKVTEKYPEIFFNKDGSLDKEFLNKFLAITKKITAEDIIKTYEDMISKERAKKTKEKTIIKTTKKEPAKQSIGTGEAKKKEQSSGETVKQDKEPMDNKQKQRGKFIDYEYLNMLYSLNEVKLKTKEIEKLFNKAINNNIKIFESIDLEKVKDAYRKLGVALTDKGEAYASGGSKPVHLVALVHEFIHNLNPKLSEQKVVGLTANTILKLLKNTEGLKEKFELTNDFIKELENQAMAYNNDKAVNKIIRFIAGNKDLRDIILGNQTLWAKWIKADQMVSDLLTKGMQKIIGSKKIKQFKELFDKKAPTLFKHILFEANILEPDEAVKKLIELKKRIDISRDEFTKALDYEINNIKNKLLDKELNKIITSGIIQLRTILNEPNIVEKIKEFDVSNLNKTQIKIIKNNLDFRISGINDSFRLKNKVDYLGNSTIQKMIDKHFGSYENYAIARASYILKDISKDNLEQMRDLIEMYHNIQSKVVNKDFLVLGYKPYIIKTLSTLRLAISEYERKLLKQQGYKEVEPYIFEVPYVEKELSSMFMNLSSTTKKTGLTRDVMDLKKIPKDILNRATITKAIKGNKEIYRISVFPKKETFTKIYASIEPEEMLRVSYSTLLNKYLNKKLASLSDFKDNLSKLVSKEPRDGYIKLSDKENNLLNKIFNTKKEQYFIKKEYKDFLLYEEKLPKNEKFSQAIKIYKGLIKRLKGNLTYKAPTAYVSNIVSGITASLYLGVNPKHIPILIKQVFKEYKEWKQYEKEFSNILSKHSPEKARQWLKTVKKNNVFAEMIYDGKIGSLNPEASILYGSTNDDKALLHILKKIDNKLGTNNAEKILQLIKTGMLDKETLIGSYLVNIYSNIDLFTRAVMYKYLKPNIGKNEAIKQINNILVDFRKEPIGSIKDIEYTTIPFLSFFLRMQGGIAKTIYKHPLSIGSIILAYYMLSDNEDEYINGVRTDSWFLHRMLADPLILQLSIPIQLYNGKLDSIIEHILLPKEYITAYKVLQDKKEPIELVGITEEPKWLQHKNQ